MRDRWKDTSSWSQRDPSDLRVPKEWTLRTANVRIVVHHHMDYEPDRWFCSAYPLFDMQGLMAGDAEAAKAEAVELVGQWLRTALRGLET